jgi:HD-GYP domain-containing protein (c-di-GMP phosphodiesterase class II)
VDFGELGKPSIRGNTPLEAAIMARAMRDDHQIQKIILVALDFSWVHEESGQAGLPAHSHLLILAPNGQILAGTANVTGSIGKDITRSRYVQQFHSRERGALLNGQDFEGKPALLISQSFKTGSGLVTVLIDYPLQDVLRPAYSALIRGLSFSFVEFVLLIALFYFLTEKYVLKRLEVHKKAATAMTEGDYSVRIGDLSGDELGQLSEAFDAMADSIQQRDMKIQAVNDELARVNRALKVLSAGNRSLLFAKSEQELLDRICREIVEAGDYLGAWIGFSGPEPDKLLRTAAAYSTCETPDHKMDWNKAGNGLEPVIQAVRTGQELVINDTLHESVHRSLGEQASKFGYRSIIILPLHFEGNPIGALILSAREANEFGSVQVQYLKETASDTSFGIEMLRTKGEKNRLALLEGHHEHVLRNSLEDALRAISITIEMRDPYTAGHQHRVAALAQAISMELGLSEDDAHGIYLAAIVHDIGKINVPAEILVKPSRLTDLEFAMVKNHVVSSHEILKGIRFPWPIAEMVYQHHERLDGSGYPNGISDGEILFGARILAVADVVEAIMSHRPYRPSLGSEVAFGEIEKGKINLYDETVVDACLRLFREGRFAFQ